MRRYRIITEVGAENPQDALKSALGNNHLTIIPLQTEKSANFKTELISNGKVSHTSFYNVSKNDASLLKRDVVARARKLLEDNDDNFVSGSNHMDENEYASGVHDGILDLLKALKIDIGEEYYN